MATEKVYTKNKTHGGVYGIDFKTPVGRFCWVNLVTPKPGMKQADGTTGKPRWEVTFILEKGEATKAFFTAVKAEVDKMLVVYNQGEKAKLSDPELFNTEADVKNIDKYPFLQGKVHIRATKPADKPCPSVYNKDKEVISPAAVEGGMLGRLVVSPFVCGKGVKYHISIIQVTEDDGVRFGGSSNREAEAKALLDDEETAAPEVVEDAPATKKTSGKGKASSLDDL